jgi:hypothetical protein
MNRETHTDQTSVALREALPTLEAEFATWQEDLVALRDRVEKRRNLIEAIRAEFGSVTGPEAAEGSPSASSSPQPDKPRTARTAVSTVLEAATGPMTTREVINAIRETGLVPDVAHPENAISAALSYLLKTQRVTKAYRGSRATWAVPRAHQRLEFGEEPAADSRGRDLHRE